MISYSFDIYQASPLNDDQNDISSDAPIDDAQHRKAVVVFRHQQTLDAVTCSPAVVRLFLEESGFGFSGPPGTAPDGYVLADNDDTRRDLKKRVIKALSNQALEKALHRVGADCDFDVRTFIRSIAKGKCGAATETVPTTPQPPETPRAPQQTAMPTKVVPATAPRRPRPVAKPITVRPAAKPIQMPDDPIEAIIPRRPSQLRRLGAKSRERPQ